MKIIMVRAKATMQFIESIAIVNDDDAMMQVNALREMDKRNEYRIDVFIASPLAELKQEFAEATAPVVEE